jgi:DNA repair exonuclease SbcCD ATPase subunit
MIRANQARLDASEGDCPVCRRPLDDATITLAHRANDVEMEALVAELTTFQNDEISALERREHAQELLRRWTNLPTLGPEPEITSDRPVSGEDLDAAAQEVSIALDRLVGARSAHLDAERRLQAARQADDAMRQLENLFRAEAEIRAALNATTATRSELLEHTVAPLASEVSQRWADLFPGRGPISTRADATITRAVNGHTLPFKAFSTGESIGATIVLRLLVAQMATTTDFCWFDEPLEHLDPSVRRQVANILAGAAAADSRLRQVVVTTYEEPLARQLRARAPDEVHLVDVRSAPTDV